MFNKFLTALSPGPLRYDIEKSWLERIARIIVYGLSFPLGAVFLMRGTVGFSIWFIATFFIGLSFHYDKLLSRRLLFYIGILQLCAAYLLLERI